MNELNKKEENGNLSEKEAMQKITLYEELWSVATYNEYLLRQKSHCKWVIEGDQNSRYFHF